MMLMIPKYIKTLRFVVLNYSVLVLLYSTAHYFSSFHWRSPFHSITAYQWRSRIVESPHLQVSFIHKTKRKEYYDSFWLAPLNCIQSKCILFFANKTWMAREWMHLVKGTEMNNIFIRWSTDLTWNPCPRADRNSGGQEQEIIPPSNSCLSCSFRGQREVDTGTGTSGST